jgi:hypothetical protein
MKILSKSNPITIQHYLKKDQDMVGGVCSIINEKAVMKLNHLSQNPDLHNKAFFFQYLKKPEGRWETFHSHKGMELLFVHPGYGAVTLEQTTYRKNPLTI